ncbi:hypothetical protein PDE_08877 [Penicillium oxalicum 114-2]|uniref:Uncharacterized protein n=1 Tax=Penicillium oxalicum (strain 114-2 / CGMCC 5302) TaxID=933388 RepID=S7ZT93_PENO1|nr:hypothetical protein PDE_08877 [Penicillium oxalicum 114-2]
MAPGCAGDQTALEPRADHKYSTLATYPIQSPLPYPTSILDSETAWIQAWNLQETYSTDHEPRGRGLRTPEA